MERLCTSTANKRYRRNSGGRENPIITGEMSTAPECIAFSEITD